MVIKNSELPLYLQYAEKFRKMILEGEFNEGDKFPAEIDLSKQYGVARITIRNAINELVRDNLLVRRPGKGTFIAEPKIEREFVNVSSFTDRMHSRGMQAGAKCHSIKLIKATEKLSKYLQIKQGDRVIEIVRIRLTNNTPVALEYSYLPQYLYPGLEEEELENKSLYHLIEKKYAIIPSHSSKTLELTRATLKEAKLLNTSTNTSLFLLMATVFTKDHLVMEYAKILFLGERFRFQVY